MSSTVQAGWHIDNDDSSIDNHSTGSTFEANRNKNQTENDQETFKSKILDKTTHNYSTMTHTDEEGWTTTSPGKTKPKEKNSKGSSTESIITTIEGDIDMMDARAQNKIYVTSPGRKYKCNIPDDRRKEELNFNPTIMEAKGGEGGEGSKEQSKEGTTEGDKETSKEKEKEKEKSTDNNSNGENEREGDDGGGNKNNDRERNGRNEGNGRGGRGGRGGRSGRAERKQIPRTEWGTYEFSISFNPKTMTNKDPDEEFQAVLSQIMKKSPGVTFHPTNEDMHPKPRSFMTIQDYPQTEAAFKDFFEVYENKGLTTYKIFIKATMQYDELDLRNSLLNYLRSNNLWMSSEFISENIDEIIGYINYGHDKMVWRPEVEKKINNGIKAMIQNGSIPEALRLKIIGLKKQIHVRVAAGTVRGGTKNEPVMCEGLVLRTTKAQARASIELLGLLDEKVLGEFYSIIPRGIDKELGPQLYGELLRTNNDMLNTLRSITVVNWPEELFLDHYNPATDIEGTIAKRVDKILIETWNCVAIERTTETDTRGKYLLIFQETDMEKAKASIGDLIEAFGRTSNRDSANIALERFQEYPEFDSIQRVSQSVQSKGLRIRGMLEAAAAQRTKSTPMKAKQPKFQFHVNKELQKQLQITTNKTYSAVTQQTTQKKKLTIVQPHHQKVQSIIRQQQSGTMTQTPSQTQGMNTDDTASQQMELNEHGMGIPREEWEEIAQKQARRTVQNAVTQESRTIATNNSGLSIDQQTITTMMTQITQQFKEMERDRITMETDRITREERQERKRQERELKAEEKREEREARIEEKQAEAQREMYKFMQTMMMINQNNTKLHGKEVTNIPEEFTTESTEQTSAITTSVTTATTNTTNGKRSSSLLSNTNEETEMIDEAKEIPEENMDGTIVIKRTKKQTGNEAEADDETIEEDEEMIDSAQQDKVGKNDNDNTIDEEMKEQDRNSSSFTAGFNSHQFQSTNIASSEATQQ
jgi:hypothetical protein